MLGAVPRKSKLASRSKPSPCGPCLSRCISLAATVTIFRPQFANALNDPSVLDLSYTETVTDENSPVPAVLSLLDPFVMVGVPLGTYTVHARARCSLTIHGRVVKSYSAESTVSRSYGLYHGSSFPELEKEAREAVEHQIEQSVYRDADEIALAAKADR